MKIDRRDIGYAIYSRLEVALRLLIRDKLSILFGNDWLSHIPEGITLRIFVKLGIALPNDDIDDAMVLLDETEIIELKEIVCYQKCGYYHGFFPDATINSSIFQEIMDDLYSIRIKIAHVKLGFTPFDLSKLIEIAETFSQLLGDYATELRTVLECIKDDPEKVLLNIPDVFFFVGEEPITSYFESLPPSDYSTDGGFIGRADDLRKLDALVSSDLYRVVTVTGAGGVGKTALVHKYCQNLLQSKQEKKFDALVWVSAKEEKLSVTGIEPLEPTFRTYEEFINQILDTYGWFDEISKPIEWKEEDVQIILRASLKGMLLVVDNLETIRDERIIEFIKTIPIPNKIIITSRLGLGEVERRYQLTEMSINDAVILMRTIAREKGVKDIVSMPTETLSNYVDRMFRYPLAIKWVVGQMALGKDPDTAICDLTSSTGDVVKFCFDYIFNSLLSYEAKQVLFVMGAYEKPLSKGVIAHISGISIDILDQSLRDLTVASLVIQSHASMKSGVIETKYELIPLTTKYIQLKLSENPEMHTDITRQVDASRTLLEEAEKAGKQYRYSLRDLGATTEEEKIASVWAFTASQKSQGGDYNGAIEDFQRAAQIAPSFPTLFRNWAIVESNAGFHGKADELMARATKLNDKDSRLWFAWGNMEKRRGRYDKAFVYLSRALSLSPRDSHIKGALAEIEKRRNNFENADRLLREALESPDVEALRQRIHRVICHTQIADNLRRWAEELSRAKYDTNEIIPKLQEAYDFAKKAVESPYVV